MMLKFCLICVILLPVAYCTSATALRSGNWGHVTYMVNPSKCYDIQYVSKYKENLLFTGRCHPDVSFETDQMEWRYDTNTHQLQHRGLTRTYGKPYCLAAQSLTRNSRLFIVPCKGTDHFKFLLRDEFAGAAVQFVTEADQRYCVEFYGSYVRSASYNPYALLYDCQSYSTSSEQWMNFYVRSNYNGPPLNPVHDPDLAAGNWGTLKLRSTGLCLAVETVYLKLQTRICHDSDEGEKFRYVSSTGEIQNWKYPESTGGKGCVTKSGNSQLYITRCTGSHEQKFIIKNGQVYNGIYQQIEFYTDHRYCLHIYSSGRAHPYRCQTSITTNSGQFFEFIFWRWAVECPKGKIPSGEGSNCKKCSAGTFNPEIGARHCHSCPPGTTSKAGASSCYFINNCHAGTYMNTNNGACVHCPVNTFTNGAGNTACTHCPSGTHTQGTGSTQCVPNQTCPAGTFVNGKSKCTACPKNTFSNTINAETCSSCPKGTYTKSTRSTACIKSTFCGPGKFHNGHICQLCPRNTFDNSVGNTECAPCPHGYETKQAGATRCTRKNNCQPGAFFSEKENKCAPCPKDTFTDKPHQAFCQKCPSGTGTKSTGSTECVKLNYCQAGKFHNGKKCINCPKNTFSDDIGAWECQECPHGEMTDKIGSSSCRDIIANDCAPGNYFNGEVCVLCPKDTYSDQRGLNMCKDCAAGYETESTGSTYCTEKDDIAVLATAAAETVRCVKDQGKPACLVKCRFQTSTNIKIKNKANISFYKLVGTNWQSIGPLAYNDKKDWFSVKVANKPDWSDAGIFKCVARYGEISGFARVRVVVTEA